MATYNKFNQFVTDMANGVHNLGSNQLTVALSDSTPSATNKYLSDISQVSYTNLSTRNITLTSSSASGATYILKLNDLTLTASGNVAQFAHVVIYNSTSASGNLICWFDYGAEVNMTTGNTFLVDFDNTNGLLQVS